MSDASAEGEADYVEAMADGRLESYDAGYAQAIKDVLRYLRDDCDGLLYRTVAALIERRFSGKEEK